MSTPISRMNDLFEYIEHNRQSSLSLEELSLFSGMSVFQIIRLFDRFCAMTPMAYIRSRRLAGSIPELLRGDSILSIALNWGFEYEQSYIRAFRDEFGMTPARFRRSGKSARIIDVPKLGGFTLSASGMLGQPALLIRPAFTLRGTMREFNYQHNLLDGLPLLSGLRDHEDNSYTAASRPSARSRFIHEYLVEDGKDGESPDVWAYPAGQWARFEYSGLHGIDPKGVQRVRLLMSLVIGGWFTETGIRWDGSFIETIDRTKCSENYCEVTFLCYVKRITDL